MSFEISEADCLRQVSQRPSRLRTQYVPFIRLIIRHVEKRERKYMLASVPKSFFDIATSV